MGRNADKTRSTTACWRCCCVLQASTKGIESIHTSVTSFSHPLDTTGVHRPCVRTDLTNLQAQQLRKLYDIWREVACEAKTFASRYPRRRHSCCHRARARKGRSSSRCCSCCCLEKCPAPLKDDLQQPFSLDCKQPTSTALQQVPATGVSVAPSAEAGQVIIYDPARMSY